MVGNAEEYAASAAVMLRIEAAADDSLLAILALSKFGIAITAIVNMMATTISSSIKEKPLSLRSLFPKVQAPDDDKSIYGWHSQGRSLPGFRRVLPKRPGTTSPPGSRIDKIRQSEGDLRRLVSAREKKGASDCSDAPIRFTSCAFAKTILTDREQSPYRCTLQSHQTLGNGPLHPRRSRRT